MVRLSLAYFATVGFSFEESTSIFTFNSHLLLLLRFCAARVLKVTVRARIPTAADDVPQRAPNHYMDRMTSPELLLSLCSSLCLHLPEHSVQWGTQQVLRSSTRVQLIGAQSKCLSSAFVQTASIRMTWKRESVCLWTVASRKKSWCAALLR